MRRSGGVFEWRWRGPAPEDYSALGLIVRFLVNVAALWLAQALVRGFDIDSAGALVFGAIIFGIVNAFIRPVVAMFSCVITCMTLGLFTLIINAAMLGLTGNAICAECHTGATVNTLLSSRTPLSISS